MYKIKFFSSSNLSDKNKKHVEFADPLTSESGQHSGPVITEVTDDLDSEGVLPPVIHSLFSPLLNLSSSAAPIKLYKNIDTNKLVLSLINIFLYDMNKIVFIT